MINRMKYPFIHTIEAVISDEGKVTQFTKLEEQTKNAKVQAKELLEKIRKKNRSSDRCQAP